MIKYFSERSLLVWGIIFLITVLQGCEKDFDEIVDVTQDNYQVTLIAGIKDTVDLKNPADSLLNLRIIFSEGSEINKVYFNVQASDKTILNSVPIELLPISRNIFENKFVLKSSNPIGTYSVNFFVTNSKREDKQVAVGYFYFNNGQDNVAPIISNLVIPDTISKGISFIFSVMVFDSNGLHDINKEDGVFFTLYRPDNTLVDASPFYMHDDGEPGFGDNTANDGIFSFRNSFLQDPTTQSGNWKFVFQARDRSGLVSNIIEHLLYVQ